MLNKSYSPGKGTEDPYDFQFDQRNSFLGITWTCVSKMEQWKYCIMFLSAHKK